MHHTKIVLGGIFNAQANHSPLVITAGQQSRSLMTLQANLTNRDAARMPHPLVKFSYEPPRAEDSRWRWPAPSTWPPCRRWVRSSCRFPWTTGTASSRTRPPLPSTRRARSPARRRRSRRGDRPGPPLGRGAQPGAGRRP